MCEMREKQENMNRQIIYKHSALNRTTGKTLHSDIYKDSGNITVKEGIPKCLFILLKKTFRYKLYKDTSVRNLVQSFFSSVAILYYYKLSR